MSDAPATAGMYGRPPAEAGGGCRAMSLYCQVTFGLFASLAVVLAALHSPGQMSVDSVIALYDSANRVASGWGTPFMAAALVWLGGGTVATSLFVAINCILTYGCLVAVLTNGASRAVPKWQVVLAFLLSLNPLFMFYVGIVWKDVMLATTGMVVATLLLLAADRFGWRRQVLLVCAMVVCGVLVPIRQQGILLAAPFAVVAAWLATVGLRRRKLARTVAFAACVAFVLAWTFGFYALSAATVTPPVKSPGSVGVRTIQAYDIVGMIAHARPGDPARWSGASPAVQADVRKHYSSERIDTIWRVEPIRNYLNQFGPKQYTSVWLHGIEHDPRAYVSSRVDAFAALLGLHDIAGCVPAFAGIYGLPEQVEALGMENGTNPRAKVIALAAVHLYATPVFRNWFYALLLLLATAAVVLRLRGETRWAGVGVAVAAWLYLLSFLPTTIACDFRYLYPVATLATVLGVFVLVRVSLSGRKLGPDAVPLRVAGKGV